ncbi:hypothetical protein LJC60_03485 [Ruminococcaceae bacterium OttesenSCG-928-D13]|nr:hypothetical protein [Ruminococcaceae bacterium OttesenSCG-928-D13]
MSVMNNRQTLEHYLGKVWLTRPKAFASSHDAYQDINVCVEENGDFTAIDRIQLAPDGTYHRKGKLLGKLEGDTFRQYIEKLVGPNGKSERDLFRQACDCYAACGDMAGVAQALNLTKERVRRILITEGAYTDDLVSKIAWLHDEGKGKSVAEIADMLKISQNTVHKNMAYGKTP